MFRILFPDDTAIPSPCKFAFPRLSDSATDGREVYEYGPSVIKAGDILPGSGVIAHYEQYQTCRLPVMFRSMLEDAFEKRSQEIEEQMIGEMVDMVRDCQAKILEEYHQFTTSPSILGIAPVRKRDPDIELRNTASAFQGDLLPAQPQYLDSDVAAPGKDPPYPNSSLGGTKSPGTLD